MKKTALILCLCLLAAALGGCGGIRFESAANAGAAVLPDPPRAEEPAPAGDAVAVYPRQVLLYYADADGALSSELRILHVSSDTDVYTQAAQALLDAPYSSGGLRPVAPEGVYVLDVTVSDGIAVISLSSEALNDGIATFCKLREAFAETFFRLDGDIRAVSVLAGGRSVDIDSVPLGALTAGQEADYARILNEQTLMTGKGIGVVRNAVVWLPEGGALIPRCAEMRLTDAVTPRAVVDLCRGTADEGSYTLGSAQIESGATPTGRRTVTLRFDPAGQWDELQAAGLVMTLAEFCPSVDGIRLYSSGTLVTSLCGISADESGLFAPAALHGLIGRTVTLYTGTPEGRLTGVRAVSAANRLTARGTLRLLLSREDCPLRSDATRADIRGVRVEDGIARIDLTSSMADRLAALDSNIARTLIYSVVNTLCLNGSGITGVRFLRCGAPFDPFPDTVSLLAPLMPNIGLIEE